MTEESGGQVVGGQLMPSNTLESNLLLLYFTAMFIAFICIHRISFTFFHIFPAASMYMIVGLFTVMVVRIAHPGWTPAFDPNVFYLLLLPPIIFNSGIEINMKKFSFNFITIMIFANIGTIINALVVGIMMYWIGLSNTSRNISMAEGFSFGSLISATDPVTTIAVFERLHVESDLYTIVVGVSVLDDAVSVILFNQFNSFIDGGDIDGVIIAICIGQFLAKFFGSMLLGYMSGIAYTFFLKYSPHLRESDAMIGIVSLCFVYMTYLVADTMYLSGIISSMFAGIALQKYLQSYHNVSFQKIKGSVNIVSYTIECMTFAYIGGTLLTNRPETNDDWKFMSWSLVACIVGRMAQIYPLSYCLNCYMGQQENNNTSRGKYLSWGYQHMMLFAGLRGPIAYATAQVFSNFKGNQNMIAFATNITVVCTTFVLGILTLPALYWFGIKRGTNIEETIATPSFKNIMKYEDVHCLSSCQASFDKAEKALFNRLLDKPASVTPPTSPVVLRSLEMVYSPVGEGDSQHGLTSTVYDEHPLTIDEEAQI